MINSIYVVLCFALIFFQTPFISGGDSSEFSLVAKTFSIAHPPGYPFYSLLSAIIVRLIPFSTITWRVGLLSSIPTTVTAWLIYKILNEYKVNKFFSLTGSLLYAFLFPVWLYSEMPEVFALNNLIIASITYLIILSTKKRENKYLYFIALMLGIAVSHHHTFVLMLPGWFLLWKNNKIGYGKVFKPKTAFFMVLLFFLGFSFYLYPIIASYFNPPLDWENAKTLSGFIRIISRAPYGVFKAGSGAITHIPNQIFDIFSIFIFLLHDFRIIGIVFILFGLIRIIKVNKPFALFIYINLSVQLFFLFYSNFTLNNSFGTALYERFLILPYLTLIFPLTIGSEYLYGKISGFILKHLKNKSLKTVSVLALKIFLIIFISIIFLQNIKIINKYKNGKTFENYAKDFLDTLPKNAIIQVQRDNSYFPTAYYYYVNRYRPDIKFIFTPYLTKPYYRERLLKDYPGLKLSKTDNNNKSLEYLLKNNNENGIFFEVPTASGKWQPYGLLWKYYPDETSAGKAEKQLLEINNKLWKAYHIPVLDKDLRNVLHLNDIQDAYLTAYKNYGKLLFAQNKVKETIAVLKKILRYQPYNPEVSLILSNIYLSQNKCKDAGDNIKTIKDKDLYRKKEFLLSAYDYYDKCDTENPKYSEYQKVLQRLNKEDCIDLEKF